MYQATLTAGQTSAPQAAGIGSVARLTISSGSGYVEYTTGSFADIGNNVATWTTWPKGTVGATAQDTAGFPMIVRFTCVTGTVAVMLADPSDAEFPSNALMPWESMQPIYAYDTSGNVTGLASGNGVTSFDVKAQTQAGAGKQILDWSADGTFAIESANGAPEAAAIDSSITFDGYPTARCTLKASTTFIATINPTTQFNAAKLRTIQVPIRFSSNVGFTDASNPIQIWMYNNGLAKQFRLQNSISTLRAGQWNVLSFAAGAAQEGWTFAGGAANSSELDVDTVQRVKIVIATPAGSDSVQIWVGPLRINQRVRRGMVSLVMDGEYTSQNDYILPMLDGYGLRSSMAIVGTNIGTGGCMTTAQVRAAAARGHELIHHTYDGSKTNGYANATDWPTAASITADIQAGFSLVANLSGSSASQGYCVHGYSYPFDQSVTQARQDLVAGAYASAGAKAIRKSVPTFLRLQNMAKVAGVDPYLVQGAIQITTLAPAVSLTLGATSGAGITFTAGSAYFTSADVGKEIYAGTGTAYAVITAAGTSGAAQTTCTVDITGTFSAGSFLSGAWSLSDGSRTLQAIIDRAETRGEWAIITIHRAVRDDVTPTTLEQRVTVMDTWLAYLAQRARIGAVDVVPFGAACRYLGLTA